MDVFDFLTMLGGLCLFLFGMNLMGEALERRAGNKLRGLLSALTSNPLVGLLTGLSVTAVIQSSSATTVMVVGFVNSGLLTLRQAIRVIMGANVGTTVTAWVLSLSGIESGNPLVQLCKPASFTPVLATIGIIFYMFSQKSTRKDTGRILLGFATLMFGMDTMSDAVKGLAEVDAFRNLFLLFENPFLGVLVGAVLTAIIQSSSASVGMLQALASTGKVSYAAALPIIMGQNIGTCVTAMLSALGANKNAKRTALVHLVFNTLGTALGLTLFFLLRRLFQDALALPASLFGIAATHTIFNLFCVAVLFPLSRLVEWLVIRLVPDTQTPEIITPLDERLLNTPSVALERCHAMAREMAAVSADSLKGALQAFRAYSPQLADTIRQQEDTSDRYEDMLGTYLVKLSSRQIGDAATAEVTKLLKSIGDFERIADHAVNVLESVEESKNKTIVFTKTAQAELQTLFQAIEEVLCLAIHAFADNDTATAAQVEPLEQVIDGLKETMRFRHILRLQQGVCSIEAGFVWSDLLTDLERVADHCSNVAGCVMNMDMNLHRSLRALRTEDNRYRENYRKYTHKYDLTVRAPMG